MSKLKEFLSSAFGKLIGTTVAGFAARVIIALLALYTGSATDAGDAVGMALDKDRSIAACAEVINETPQPVIAEAVAKEND